MATSFPHIPREDVRIASPCPASWEKMRGDDRVRFCGTCEKNVYNLSDMSKRDAERLIREKEGDMCVQLHLRADGTIITDDCPVALRPVRKPMRWLGTIAMMAIAPAVTFGAVMLGGKAGGAASSNGPNACPSPLARLRTMQPIKAIADWFDPVQAAAVVGGNLNTNTARLPKKLDAEKEVEGQDTTLV